jgi:hypothetical protein
MLLSSTDRSISFFYLSKDGGTLSQAHRGFLRGREEKVRPNSTVFIPRIIFVFNFLVAVQRRRIHGSMQCNGIRTGLGTGTGKGQQIPRQMGYVEFFLPPFPIVTMTMILLAAFGKRRGWAEMRRFFFPTACVYLWRACLHSRIAVSCM